MSGLKYSLSSFTQAQNAPEEFEEDTKQISTGSTNHDNIIFLVIFAGIALKLENVGLTYSGFNPCPSLPSIDTENRKEFQYLT